MRVLGEGTRYVFVRVHRAISRLRRRITGEGPRSQGLYDVVFRRGSRAFACSSQERQQGSNSKSHKLTHQSRCASDDRQRREEVAFRCFSKLAKIVRLPATPSTFTHSRVMDHRQRTIGWDATARSSRKTGVLYLVMLLHLYTEHGNKSRARRDALTPCWRLQRLGPEGELTHATTSFSPGGGSRDQGSA